MNNDNCAVKIGRLTRLMLGYIGEASTREIQIDLAEWWAEYPEALVAIQVLRPYDRYKYFAAYERTGDVATWTVSSGELKYAGKGLAQITLYNPDSHQEYKSRVVETIVAESLEEFNTLQLEESDPAQKWVNQTLEAAAEAQEAAENALESANNAQASAEAAQEAAENVDNAANQFGMLGGNYALTVGAEEIVIDATGSIMRVLAGNTWHTVTADRYTLTQPSGINHGIIVFEDGAFTVESASSYTQSKTKDKVAVGTVYWDANGKITKYEINGQVKDKVAAEETQIAMSMAANQFGMLGGNYTLTVGAEEITIDARNGLMRVLGGNTWWTVPARKWVLSKPEGLNHGIIYFSWDAFRVVGASAFLGDKNEEQFPVGIVYWDANGKITKYEINGQVSDQRTPAYGGDVVRDVRLFGATGDGVTDDTDAIQAALDACTNGILYFPNGTYLFRKTLYIHSNTHIMGNKGYTRIKLKPQQANELDELEWRPADNRSKYPAVRTDENSTGVIVEGIIFEGDTTYFHDLQQNGLYITGSHHVIQDCQFIKWNYFPDEWAGRQENASAWGLAICHAIHIKVEDCHFNQNGYEGAGTEFSYQVDFRGCYFGKAMRTALQIHRSSARISLEGCVLNNSVDDDNPLGDFATMTFHGANGALIDGVKIVNCDFRHRHIQCVDGYERNVQISNCRIYSDSNRFVAITMGGSANPPQDEGWQIVGNEFFSTKEDGQTTIHANVNASMVACNIIHTNANTPVVLNGTSNLAVNNLVVPVSVA